MPRITRLPPRTVVALAACAFALPTVDGTDAVTIQLLPAGEFKPGDGRAMSVAAWHIDAAIAARVITRFQQRANPPVLDYEHQTLQAEANGQPAPAAGWIRALDWREGQGLFATVELTARAREYIAAGEYRYVSPVFVYDGASGEVLAIEMAAITNHPAIDGMQPLALRAAATFGYQEDSSMNKLFVAVCAALHLDADNATEDQAVMALTTYMSIDPLADVRQALGVAIDAKPEAVIAACTARTAPNPAEFVAVATFEQVKSELAALAAKLRDGEVANLVESGLADGRLLPAQKDWATQLGQKDTAALTAYLETAQPIAALSGTQTRGQAPEQTAANPHALTADELAVCSATGISAESFAAAKAA